MISLFTEQTEHRVGVVTGDQGSTVGNGKIHSLFILHARTRPWLHAIAAHTVKFTPFWI